ncbi:MAG: 23S rRNA (pseudouridine(1915)-N(3))-methyltransferase RlmH [Burkholderiales bacterium]
MKLRIAWIGKTKESAIQTLSAEYLKRLARYVATEGLELPDEQALIKLTEKSGRTAPVLVLMDQRGKQVSSEELANFLRYHRDQGTQDVIFAIGPADGWESATLTAATQVLSMGKMTLPHELARVVLLEQLYRGYTILTGHPYHAGH